MDTMAVHCMKKRPKRIFLILKYHSDAYVWVTREGLQVVGTGNTLKESIEVAKSYLKWTHAMDDDLF